MSLFFKNNKELLLKRFTYIFLLSYTLNAPKINDLYITKKSLLKKKWNNNKLKSIYTFILDERGLSPKIYSIF